MDRLSHISPSLAAELRTAGAPQRLQACLRACECAVASCGIQHATVDAVLELLRSDRACSAADLALLVSLREQFDDEYLTLQEQADVAQSRTVPSTSDGDFDGYFRKARAVAAIAFACRCDGDTAAECLYEAIMAVGEHQTQTLILSVQCLLSE